MVRLIKRSEKSKVSTTRADRGGALKRGDASASIMKGYVAGL